MSGSGLVVHKVVLDSNYDAYDVIDDQDEHVGTVFQEGKYWRASGVVGVFRSREAAIKALI